MPLVCTVMPPWPSNRTLRRARPGYVSAPSATSRLDPVEDYRHLLLGVVLKSEYVQNLSPAFARRPEPLHPLQIIFQNRASLCVFWHGWQYSSDHGFLAGRGSKRYSHFDDGCDPQIVHKKSIVPAFPRSGAIAGRHVIGATASGPVLTNKA